jgi:hypothetical protein
MFVEAPVEQEHRDAGGVMASVLTHTSLSN